MKIFISPSSQENNLGASGYIEELYMNKIADILIPELNRHGIETARNNKADTYAGHVIKSNAYKPDIHFAIHSNAGGGSGAEVFCYDPSNLNSISTQLANKMYKRISAITPTTDRGVKKGTFAEIVNVTAPSVLIEIEFHDNKQGAEWLMNNIAKIAHELLLAILEQFKISYKPVIVSDPHLEEIRKLKEAIAISEKKVVDLESSLKVEKLATEKAKNQLSNIKTDIKTQLSNFNLNMDTQLSKY